MQEYWIVLAEQGRLQVAERPEGGAYRDVTLLDSTGATRAPVTGEAELPLRELFPGA
ncbi:MAG: hypothetical protein AAF790_02185 [Planctomycetota bacterium]